MNLALMLSYHHLRSNIQVCFSSKFLDLSTGVISIQIEENRFRPFFNLRKFLPSFRLFRVTPEISD